MMTKQLMTTATLLIGTVALPSVPISVRHSTG